jgi:pre-mRNA-splicing factor ISY1
MLNRWSEFRKEEKFGRIDHRPGLTTMENSMERAQGWRLEIVKEVARMISEIQAENLDQHRVRDLNDQINKRMRLKRAWEHRIIELGGPNYLGVHPTQFIDAGVAPDMKGGAYRYYGAAKKLPGIRELLDASSAQNEKRAVRSIEQIQRRFVCVYWCFFFFFVLIFV